MKLLLSSISFILIAWGGLMHYNDWDYPVTYSFGTYSLIIGFALAGIAIVMQVRELKDEKRFLSENESEVK